MAKERIIKICANWDVEHRIWYGTCDDMPTLTTEHETVEDLIEEIKWLVPELVEAGGLDNGKTKNLSNCKIEVEASRYILNLSNSVAA